MSQPTVEQLAEAMFEMIKSTHGKKNLKAMDLIKAMIQEYGEEAVDKKMGKAAVRQLIDSGRCIYSYVGGSYVTLPE